MNGLVASPQFRHRVSIAGGRVLVVVGADEGGVRSALADFAAEALGVPAEMVRLQSVSRRAPQVLVGGSIEPGMSASLSRRGGWVAGAMGLGASVGIDLEAVDEAFPWAAVAEAYFPREVQAELNACTGAGAARRFAEAWSQLEAGLKCLGEGLVLAEPADGWRRIRTLRHAHLGAPEGFVLSLAVRLAG